MNRTAYLTTGLAIKTLSALSKADIYLHGEENIPSGPVIFVVNHFTRVETFLLPFHIHQVTGKPVWSLAHGNLFHGGLAKFLDLVGAISTTNPNRDQVIVKTLLTGEANWIIFPEGRMVKTKKIINDGQFMVADPQGMRKPHTGAASLALRADLFRRYLTAADSGSPAIRNRMLASLEINDAADIRLEDTSIVPVNLTYYPLRAKENIASTLAARMVKDLPERMVEEIMTEGTMLLSGVDLDIRFGSPLVTAAWLDDPLIDQSFINPENGGFFSQPLLLDALRAKAEDIMQRYMEAIYSMTTINHEHLFAAFLRLFPFRRIRERDLRSRVFFATQLISDLRDTPFYLHKSLEEPQTHLLTDDRFDKVENFLQLALEKGVLHRKGDYLVLDRSKLSAPVIFHRGRLDNPIEIMANEVEPLGKLYKLLRTLAWLPEFPFRCKLAHHLYQQELFRHAEDCRKVDLGDDQERKILGKPFLLAGHTRRTGIVLLHSYLAVPDEVRTLAAYLNRMGYWIWAPRLPGHGTSSADLATRSAQEWIETAEIGYALLRNTCEKVMVAGFSVGGVLALNLAARIPDISGVVAVCPPLKLQDFSSKFMPNFDVWNRMLQRMKGASLRDRFFEFHSENPHINYLMNPYSGIREVGRLLEQTQERLADISQPALIIQADFDPVVQAKSARAVYEQIGSAAKEFSLISADRHTLISGHRSPGLHRKIAHFIREYCR